MALFDKLSGLAKNVGEKASDTIEIGKLNSKIKSEESAIEAQLQAIGQVFYDRYAAGQGIDPAAAGMAAAIDGHKAAIAAAQNQIQLLKDEPVTGSAPAGGFAAAAPVAGFAPSSNAGAPAPVSDPMFGTPAPAADPMFGAPAPAADPMFGSPAPAADPMFGTTAPAADPMFGSPAPAVDPMFGSPASAANLCPSCGTQLDAGAKFCGECGTRIG